MPSVAERQQRLFGRYARYVKCQSMLFATNVLCATAMTAAQARLADTIDTFYSASDKSSESAMAAHAYKRGVEDLDTGIGRELVRCI